MFMDSPLFMSPSPNHKVPRRQTGFSGLLVLPSLVCGLLGMNGTAEAQAPAANSSRAESALRQTEALQQAQAVRDQQKAAAPGAGADDEVPETYPGENADLGPQVLLKQKAPQRKPLFEFSADTMFTWTSNALSAEKDLTETGIVAETFSLTLAPEPLSIWGGKLALRAGYRHLLWMYDVTDKSNLLNASNFEMSTFFVGANFNFLENWNASLGVDHNRILFQKRPWDFSHIPDPSNWTEGYVEWNPNWSLSRNISLADKLNLSLAYNGGYHISRTDPNPGWEKTDSGDKFDSGVSLSLIWAPVDKWVLIPSMRFTHSLYTHGQQAGGHRQDRSLGPGMSVMFLPTQRVALRFSVGGEFRHTTDSLSPRYSKLDVGSGVTFSLKF